MRSPSVRFPQTDCSCISGCILWLLEGWFMSLSPAAIFCWSVFSRGSEIKALPSLGARSGPSGPGGRGSLTWDICQLSPSSAEPALPPAELTRRPAGTSTRKDSLARSTQKTHGSGRGTAEGQRRSGGNFAAGRAARPPRRHPRDRGAAAAGEGGRRRPGS